MILHKFAQIARVFKLTLVVGLVCSTFSGASLVAADVNSPIYRWKGRDGAIHYTDDLGQVPPAQRGAAEKEALAGTPGTQGTFSIISDGPPGITTSVDQSEDVRRNEWQQKIAGVKNRIELLKKDLRAAEDRRQIAKSKFYSVSSSLELTAVENDIERIERDLSLAREELNAIPDAARRAGIPPGWVREATTDDRESDK